MTSTDSCAEQPNRPLSSSLVERLPPAVIVGGVTLFGACLRFYHLGFKALWLDEAALFWIANHPIRELIAQNADVNSAPPLFALLLKAVIWVGESERVLRGLPWLGGVVSIPVLYFLARQFLARVPSYFVALLAACAPTQVLYSQQLREYSLTFALAALMMALAVRFMRRPSVWGGVSIAAAFSVGIFLQYGLAILAAALNLVFILDPIRLNDGRGRRLIGWTLAHLAVACAVFAVYRLSLGEQMKVGFGAGAASGYLNSGYWNRTARGLLRLGWTNTWNLVSFAYPGGAFLLFVGLGLVSLWRDAAQRARTLALFAIPPMLTFSLALLRLYPYDGVRQDIFLTPILYVIAGFGLRYLMGAVREQWIVAVCAFLVCLAGFQASRAHLERPSFENIRPIVGSLASSFEPGDRIYVYYAARPAFTYYYRENRDALILAEESREDLDSYFAQIDAAVAQPGRIWMVFAHDFADEREQILGRAARARKIEQIAQDLGVWLYLALEEPGTTEEEVGRSARP